MNVFCDEQFTELPVTCSSLTTVPQQSTVLSGTSCSLPPVTAHTFKEGMATEFSERFCSGAEGIVESSESGQLSCRRWLGLRLDGTEQNSGKLQLLWRCHCDKSLYEGRKSALNQEWKGWGEEKKEEKKKSP